MIVLRNRHLLVLDAVLLAASPLAAYAVRAEGFDWSATDLRIALAFAALSLPLKLSLFAAWGLYRRLWRYANTLDVEQTVEATITSAVACLVLGVLVLPGLGLTPKRLPISVLFLDGFFTLALVLAPRVLAAIRGAHPRHRHGQRRVLIAGAGSVGESIVRELHARPELGLAAIGFVDDDRRKHHHRLCGLPVFGSLSEIRRLVVRHGVKEVILAMPDAPGSVVRMVVHAAHDVGAATRTVPRMHEILSGRVGMSSLREVRIDDLLRRAPVEIDLERVGALVRGRTVLVTGAGGSIGSELCRQLARFDPESLMLLGHGENSIFELHHELRGRAPDARLVPLIADIRDAARVAELFERHRPDVVLHAAAHKHVPLMEDNVVEAVTNNVLGTRNVVHAAAACGAGHLVMISTDKAVRPSSVMGATKRVAELVVQQAALAHERRYMAVRFGNVLGSRGSVIPTFLRQIRAGGPVTITHPEMRRFFMTIPEAVQLVLQAGALGRGGEVFVLDMGEPVRIVDLATDVIRLSGLEVGADIAIEFVGTRPGEKLFEEMFFDGEHASPTDHPKVLRARNVALNDTAMRAVDALLDAAALGVSEPELRALLRCIVPDFVSPDHRAEEPHPVAAPAGAYGAPTLAPTASRLQLTGTGGSS